VTCTGGFTLVCGNGCPDIQTDEQNCGGCNMPCAGTCAGSVCSTPWTGPRNFTTCGQTGNTGPTQLQCDTAYTATTLAGEVTVAAGIQSWTVPVTATYHITASGGAGGSILGGLGADMAGDFALTSGTVLSIVVGQQGTSVGAGGGSFVVRSGNTPLLVAGGGGDGVTGAWAESAGQTTEAGGSGANAGATLNNGGTAGGAGGGNNCNTSGGGGGFMGTAVGAEGGQAFIAGANGGVSGSYPGGFGGGGANRGGGGGYSGGGSGGCGSGIRVGGGGGSFNAGTNPTATVGAHSGAGQVTIDLP
jgi:hypothetical protein